MKNKKAFKIIIILFLLLLIGITSFLGFYFFNMRDLDFMLGRIRISESSNVTYAVDMKDEDYRNNLDIDDLVTDLIKDIRATFNYNVAFNDDVSGEYNYYIQGRMELINDKGVMVAKKDIYSMDGKKESIDGKVINISSTFDIDFVKYKMMYDEEIKEYGINLDGNLVFDVIIDYKTYNEGIAKDINNSKTLTIKIPLGKETTRIDIPKKAIIQRTEYSDAKNEYSSIYFIIAMEFFGTTLLFILVLILVIRSFYMNISEYDRRLAYIINKYKGRIVKIRELPNLSDVDVLFVDDIDALDDASINVMSPINYVEVIKNCESVFIVFNDDKAYVYKLMKEEDTD